MAKRITLYVLTLILVLITLLGFMSAQQVKAVDPDNWNHVIPFTITDTSGVARTNVPVIISCDTDGKLVAYGLVNATATDTYMDSSGASNSPIGSGTAYDFLMATSNITAIIPSLPAYGSVTLNLYTGYSPAQTSFPIILGNGGYVTVPDAANLELSANGTIKTTAYIDTGAGDNKTIMKKPNAISVIVSDVVSGNITAWTVNDSASSVTLRPSGAGSETSIASLFGAATHWEAVDDVVADNATSYVYTNNTAYERDLYGIPASGLASGSIVTQITIYFDCTTGGGEGKSRASLYTHGTAYDGATEYSDSSAAWVVHSETWATNPHTGLGWTVDEIEALEIGVSLKKVVNGEECTQVYVTIDYYPVGVELIHTGITSGEHDVELAIESPFYSLGIDAGEIPSPVDDTVVSALPHFRSFHDGGNYVDITHSANQLLTSGGSIEAWIKVDTAGESNAGRIVDKSQSSTATNGFYLACTASNSVTFKINSGTGRSSADNSVVFGDGNWYHVVATFDDTGYTTLYVNGSQAGVPGISANPSGITTTNDLRIGGRSGTTDTDFDGLIACVNLYDSVLTSTQVAAQYAKGEPTAPITPVADGLVLNIPAWQSEFLANTTSIDSYAVTVNQTGPIWTLDEGWDFDGADDYVDVGHDSSQWLTNGGTLIFIIKVDSAGELNAGRIVDKSQSSTATNGFYLACTASNSVTFKINSGTGRSSADNSVTFGDGNCYHVAATFNGTGYTTMYVNKEISGTPGISADPSGIIAPVALRLGNRSAFTDYSFNGTIAEGRIYNTIFTVDEIEQDYNATMPKYIGGDIVTHSSLLTIPNTSDDWIFCSANTTPYSNNVSVSVDGTMQLWFSPNAIISGTTLPDRQGGDNNGTITWGTNNDMTVTGGSITTSNSATSIGVTSAMMQGNLFYMGTYATSYTSFQYGLNDDYGYSTSETSQAVATTYSVTLTGLTPNTTYHYRMVSRSGSVYSYGADTTFTTAFSASSEGSTTPLIINIGAFSGYQDAGDLLFTAECVLTYPPYYPTAIPYKYFQLQLLDTDHTTVIGASPIYQWGDRPASIYFSPIPASSLTYGAEYMFRIKNISSANITEIATDTFESGDWYGSDLTNLDQWCRGVAWSMQNTDGTLLTDPYLQAGTSYGTIITETAGGYFTVGIPNISQIRPNLFGSAEYKATITTLSGGINYNLGVSLTDRLGAGIVADATTVGDVFNLSASNVALFLIFGVVLLFIGWTLSNTGGFGAFGALILSTPFIMAGIYLHMINIAMIGAVAVVMVFVIVWGVWWSRT